MTGDERTLCQFEIPEGLFRGKRVLVLAYMSQHDADVGSQGDSPTIKSLMNTIARQGGNAAYSSYSEFGAIGKMIKFMERLKKKSISNRLSGSQTRWMYTAIFHFLTYAVSRADVFMQAKVKQFKNNGYDIYLLFYPYLFSAFKRQLSGHSGPMSVLFEPNIERKFFEFQFSKSKLNLLKNALCKLIGTMESKSIAQSDAVITVAMRDAKELSLKFDGKPIYALPVQEGRIKDMKDKKQSVKVRDVFRRRHSELGPDTLKVTFMGSNYSLNVSSVNELMKLARKMSECKDKIKFIVVGDIHHAFSDQCEVPENVIFTGYLRDFNEVMCASDFFILFDQMQTGIESKSRVYSQFPGLTIALTNDSEEYLPILRDKLVPFDSIDSIEKFLRDSSFGLKTLQSEPRVS